MQMTHEHHEIQRTLKRFIDEEINPHVDEWEAAEEFPAHEVFKKPRRARPARPHQAREVRRRWRSTTRTRWRWPRRSATSRCGGVPMAIGVQTDMATPALARFGSDALLPRVPRAGDRRRDGRLHRRLRARRRLRRREHQDDGAQGRRRLRHQRREDVDHQQPAGRLDVPAREHVGRRGAQEQEPDHGADEDARRRARAEDPQDRHDVERHRPDPLRRRARAAAQPHRRGRHGLHLPDDAVPGGAPLGGGACDPGAAQHASSETIDYARERQIFGKTRARPPGRALQARRAEDRGRGAARAWSTWRPRSTSAARTSPSWRRWPSSRRAGSARHVPDACLQYWGGMGYTWDNPVARHYRDGRLGSIGGGADEVMLGIIAKYMHTLPSRH